MPHSIRQNSAMSPIKLECPGKFQNQINVKKGQCQSALTEFGIRDEEQDLRQGVCVGGRTWGRW